MNPIHAALLGLIEGITEYLPVSANAHVLILGNILNEDPELVRSFGVALQAAPTVAVLILFWRRYLGLFAPSQLPQSNLKGSRAWLLFSLGVLPVLVVGFLFKNLFYSLMLSPWPSVMALGLGGVAILAVEHGHKESDSRSLEALTPRDAILIGLAQCLALWPGVSRSGATIIAALGLGMKRQAAAEFSFLIGAPVFAAAAVMEIHKSGILHSNASSFGIAFAVSLICALLTVEAVMRFVGKLSFKPFGWYRILLAPLLWFYFR